MNIPPDISGVWKHPLNLLDTPPWDESSSDPAANLLHGTVVTQPLLLARTLTQNAIANAVVEIFDQAGGMARFVWNSDQDMWLAAPGPVDFSVKANSTFKVQLAYQPDRESLQKKLPSKSLPTDVDTWTVANDIDISVTPSLYLEAATAKGNGLLAGEPFVASDAAQYAQATQSLKLEDPDTLLWNCGSLQLELQPTSEYLGGQSTQVADQQFNYYFKNSLKTDELKYPFYGFNPLSVDLFGTQGFFISSTGSPTPLKYPSNPDQEFLGTLLFRYPYNLSVDYVQGLDSEQAYVPLGTWVAPDGQAAGSDISHVFESTAEKIRSQSASLGLKGGIEGMLDANVSVEHNTESEQTSESKWRYAQQLEVTRKWAYNADMSALLFKEQFLASLQTRCSELLAGKTPNWSQTVDDFGTHYYCGGAMGNMRIDRTWFSLDLEASVYGAQTTLKAAADGVFDGLKGGGDTNATNAWKNKYKTSLETEFSSWNSLGEDTDSVLLALDLRPLSELLNPVLVRPVPISKLPVVRETGDYGDNLDDQWYELAPVVWYKLRQSLSDYLLTLGINGPITLTANKDLDPVVRQISFSPMNLNASSSGDWPSGLYFDTPSLEITLPALAGTSTTEPAYVQTDTGTVGAIPSNYGSCSYPTLNYITRPSAPMAIDFHLKGHFAVAETDPQGDGTSGESILGTVDFDDAISIVNGAFSIAKSFTVESNGWFNWSSVGGETITITLSGVLTELGTFDIAE